MGMEIKDRLQALRALMRQKGIDVYLVPTDDYHTSEYVGEHFKCRHYITGFTGSAGTAVIWADGAGLWTDGRYFIQAKQQLAGSGVELFRMGEPGVPEVDEFLKEHLKKGECLGFDGRTVTAARAEKLIRELEQQGVTAKWEEDLIGEIWADRPPLSCEPVSELALEWCGKSREDKCAQLRKELEKEGAEAFLLTSLDDIAWLLNIRGGDVRNCPVALAYLILTQQEILLFARETAFSEALRRTLAGAQVRLLPYEAVYEQAGEVLAGKKVLLDKKRVNYLLARRVESAAQVVNRQNPTILAKAIKNETEVANERIAHIKDGVAVTRFIFWLKQNVGKMPITELSASRHLHELRSQQEHFLGDSFDPIISYGAHGAIVHYSATPETDIAVEPHGFVLADTGGHYLEGSTDITRTIAVGPVTEEEKKYFTAVLRGALHLAAARFPHGTTGLNLDCLARLPLWELGVNFNHGTGHGVGYCLNVHEAPNRFAQRGESAVMEEGMITSDEPGYYQEGAFGIRHENLLVCQKAEKTAYGQFLRFEYLTLVPFDLDAVAPEQMSAQERKLLNDYHALVYEKISPYLDAEEQAWLREATRAI